jgi:4-amino-4-deoxy-L-arabinose transferase-like glycosyltransferase
MPKTIRIIFILLFLVGAGVRAVDVWRPVDGTIRESWRECDIAAVARNFYREGMNILYPRIDWRGDGPGYGEMEFPIYPWAVAVLYKTLGLHEELGRLLSYGFSLASLVVFFKLARYLLPVAGAIGASLFFVLSPLAVRIANGLQPEGLMFLCSILAAYAFIRWLDENKSKHYWIALGATALAILAKANAGHIGLFFAAVLLTEKGFGVLRSGRVWVFAILSLLPGALWYHHAHNLWLTYGNSLGVSNEYHWIGWDFFSNPRFIVGITKLEILYVWMPAGLMIAGIAMLFGWKRKEVRLSLYWYASILVYYVITSRTSSDSWATYYHVVSVPPAAILIGFGADTLYRFGSDLGYRRNGIAIILLLSFLLASVGFWAHPKVSAILSALGFLVFLWAWLYSPRIGSFGRIDGMKSHGVVRSASIYLGLALLVGTLSSQIAQVAQDLHPNKFQIKYACATMIRPLIPEDSLIIASGGECKDEDGYPVAYNASYFFYWLDRKGYNICTEEQSLEKLRYFVGRGARHFIGERDQMDKKPGFEGDVRQNFRVLAECKEAILFDLSSR